MKVLWFALTPCNGGVYLNNVMVTAGWLSALENQIKNAENIELHVSFFYDRKICDFVYDKVNYYPVNRGVLNNKIGVLINRILMRTKYFDRNSVTRFLEIIDLVQPDIIHIHGTEECFGLLQEYTNIPVVVSIQGLLNPYKEKYFVGIPKSNIKRYQSILSKLLFNDIDYKFKLFTLWANRERKILGQSKNIIGRTVWDKRITSVLAPNSKYYVGNEILRSSFYNKKWQKDKFEDTLQLVTTMSNGIYKGLEMVMNTSKVLKHFGLNFKWTIVGQQENDLYPKLVRQYTRNDFAEFNVCFEGKKNESELVQILLKSDIYCQVSHIENSPNSICEAMLIGMPIVATFAGGTESLLLSNYEGVLVQSGDCYSYAGAIVEMKNDFHKAKKMAHNAALRANERHNPENIKNEYISIYKEIIK